MDRFFAELGQRLDEAQREDLRRYQRFFDELMIRLESARELDRQLNHHLAYRFNVFEYLRTDELGLSRIISDLLDPEAKHGQGHLFLQALLQLLGVNSGGPDTGLMGTRVTVERVIKEQRRIDIVVEMPADDGRYCLAIENKPYADDQKSQVVDYLEYLASEYDNRFLLIYLSPDGEGPTEWSLPRTDLERWHGRLVVMPYHGQAIGQETRDDDNLADELDDFRTTCSLACWLAMCRKQCQVERLRWFLKDAEIFCRRTFGVHAMATDSEVRAVNEYLLSNRDHLKTAQVVYESWPAIKELVCRQFLQHLCSRVEREVKKKLSKFANDIHVDCEYGGEARWSNHLWIYRHCWKQYKTEESEWSVSTSKRRTTIHMEADSRGPNGWFLGVRSATQESKMVDEDRKRRLRLDAAIKEAVAHGRRSDHWVLWNWIDDEKRDWNELVPDLHQENQAEGGDITDFFVHTIVDFATRAIPVINCIDVGED